jgi:catechol 2,3-dioxygenase-like lactoylglutathione lyase family enzyme
LANVALSTARPDVLAAWYRDALGFTIRDRAPGVGGVTTFIIERDGVSIDLIRVPNQRPVEPPLPPPDFLQIQGLRNLVFWVDDQAAANAHLKRLGVPLLWESREVEGIGTAITAFRDPDGNLVALWERRPGARQVTRARARPAPSAPGPAPADSTFAWRLGGAPEDAYTLVDTAPAAAVLTRRGTALTLSRRVEVPPPGGGTGGTYGTAGVRVPALAYRDARVRVRAELRARAVETGASLWLRVDGPGGAMLGFVKGEDRSVAGTGGWVPQVLTVDVPPTAERLVLGTLLTGGGAVQVRGLRLERVLRPAADAPVHPDVRAVFDSALALAKRHALWRDTVTWSAVEPALRRALAGAARREDAYPVVAMLTRRLGDGHSFFAPPEPAPSAASADGPPVDSASSDEQAARATRRGGQAPGLPPDPPPEARWIAAERVGYLRVPAHGALGGEGSRAFATAARAALANQHASGACGYVVDLRGNGGGDMWPMLAGLRPLLGADTLGAFRSGVAPGAPTTWWTTRAPTDRADAFAQAASPGRAPWPDLSRTPVAVLTDGQTASSGEAVAIAFRGRPHARSFGAPTYGAPTWNTLYALPGGGRLGLTTGVTLDRRGQVHVGAIAPDALVPMEAGRDAPLAAALAWLATQPACPARARAAGVP